MRKQDFRRIVHLAQPCVEHLENADFERSSETVLDSSQNTVYQVVVPFELKYNIDDVLQDFRAGDRAVLGDVTDDEDRCSGRFGVFEQRCRTFADLRNAPGRRFDDVGIDGLDRVYDHQVGPLLFDLGQNIFQQSFGIDQTPFVADAQTQGPHLDLLGRLFARNIEGFQAVVRQGDLQAEGRFADTRLAAEQHEGAGHEPPPNTRFTSRFPRSMRRCSLSWMSAIRCGRALGRLATVAGPPPLSRAITSSVNVFHSPQEGQRPNHLGASKPQLRQKNAFLTFAMSYRFSGECRCCRDGHPHSLL